MNESPHRPHVRLDAAFGQFQRQLGKVNGPERMRLRSQSALAPDRILCPPILPGETPPVSRLRFSTSLRRRD
jgi:hypothetical protein